MAQTNFNVGTIANDGTGDALRVAFQEQQAMNTELYTNKVDKVIGKELSDNNYTDDEVTKLDGIEAGAEVNVQADWEQSDDTQDDYIKNKPTQLFSSVGYFHYTDTLTQTTPLTIIADTNKKLTNDGLGAQTNLTQAPYGVSTLFNTTTNEFDFSQLSIGDTLDLRVDLSLTTTSANQKYLVFLRVGEGSASQYDLPIFSGQIKNISSNNRIIGNEPFSIDYQEHIDNPATLYILSDDDGSVKVNGWYTSIIRKSVNIVDIQTEWGAITGDIENQEDLTDYVIPRGGTEVDKPITGILRVEGDNGNGIVSTFDDKTSGINFNGTNSSFFAIDDVSTLGTNLSITPDGLLLSSSEPASRGLKSDTDFSPNITDLDYPQKIYVDNHATYTNVKFFGAVGDGVTNDSTAIQSAIDFLNANGGGTLFFPKGAYGIATAIQPKDGVYMIGEGVDLDFQANCPDLKFVIIGGSYFVPLSGLEYCIKANAVDSAGVSSGIKALSNVHFKDFGIKGFKYPIKIGAINQLGMGMGGFENIIIDGTASNNTTVVTQQGIELYNAQQISNKGIFMYNVRNGLKIFNSKETPQCSSGNSVWDKVYVYLDPSVTSETSVSISSITTGTKTTIVTSGNHNLKVGDIFQVNGVTGTDAGIFSRVLKVSVVDSATQIQTDLTSTGKTIIATGTLEKGRVGIHLCAEGIEPLNHITFIAPQVNAFLASSNPNKAIVNIAVCGTLTSRVGAVNFIETDTEGLTDGHFYLDGCANLGVKIATVINTFPFGHMAIYNTDSLVVNANDVDLTLKIGDLRYSDGNNNINVNGYVKTFLTNSRFPSYGMWRTVESSVTKSYIGADSVAPAFVLDNTTSGIAKSISDTWKPFRIMEKRDSAKTTGTATISLDRCGYLECTNASDAIITIPKTGTGTNEAKVGTLISIQKISGAGKVNIVSADSTQLVGGVLSSAGGYQVNANVGSCITLMSTGFTSWMIVGGANL